VCRGASHCTEFALSPWGSERCESKITNSMAVTPASFAECRDRTSMIRESPTLAWGIEISRYPATSRVPGRCRPAPTYIHVRETRDEATDRRRIPALSADVYRGTCTRAATLTDPYGCRFNRVSRRHHNPQPVIRRPLPTRADRKPESLSLGVSQVFASPINCLRIRGSRNICSATPSPRQWLPTSLTRLPLEFIYRSAKVPLGER
jgi:hypothetical protein